MKNNILLFLLMLFAAVYAFGKDIKVMVVDTGLDISHWEIRSHVNIANWTKSDYTDQHGHGTHVTGIILKNVCDQVEIISCKYFAPNGSFEDNLNRTIECFKQSITEHIDIVNYSSGGKSPSLDEIKAIKDMSDHGIILNVAAGNNGEDISKETNAYFPAKYVLSNINVIGNLQLDGKRTKTSNYGLKGMHWEVGTKVWSTLPFNDFGYMTGTSQATAKFTNKMLLKMCKDQNGR